MAGVRSLYKCIYMYIDRERERGLLYQRGRRKEPMYVCKHVYIFREREAFYINVADLRSLYSSTYIIYVYRIYIELFVERAREREAWCVKVAGGPS